MTGSHNMGPKASGVAAGGDRRAPGLDLPAPGARAWGGGGDSRRQERRGARADGRRQDRGVDVSGARGADRARAGRRRAVRRAHQGAAQQPGRPPRHVRRDGRPAPLRVARGRLRPREAGPRARARRAPADGAGVPGRDAAVAAPAGAEALPRPAAHRDRRGSRRRRSRPWGASDAGDRAPRAGGNARRCVVGQRAAGHRGRTPQGLSPARSRR